MHGLASKVQKIESIAVTKTKLKSNKEGECDRRALSVVAM